MEGGETNMDTIVKMKFGSHLYGTATPESDTDYKGVFLPSGIDIAMGNIPKSVREDTKEGTGKNSSDDVDSEFYSLQYFIKMALEGQTVALDMLHAPIEMLEPCSNLWLEILSNRKSFYTKNSKAFVQYARKQAAKYGVKGSRLAEAEEVFKFLSVQNPKMKLGGRWHELPTGEHVKFIQDNKQGIKQYQVCGKIIQETVTIEYAMGIVQTFINQYGARAIMARNNEGIDWKAISHAFRAAFQVKEMLKYNTITFPRPEAWYLKQIKQGKCDYNIIGPELDSLISKVEELTTTSNLPEKPDTEYWENWVFRKVGELCFR